MAKQKAIYYPPQEGLVDPWFQNAVNKLAGAIGTKYSTDPAVVTKLQGHKTNIPAKIAQALADSQTAQTSTALKNHELADAKLDMLMELKRITSLSIWDEDDAAELGIRVVKAPIDLLTVKPRMTHTTSLPDQNIIDWVKAHMDGVIVESIVVAAQPNPTPIPTPLPPPPTHETQGWEVIGKDQKSPFEDTRPNQTHLPEARYYCMRYIKDDKPVGVYSDIIKVISEIYAD